MFKKHWMKKAATILGTLSALGLVAAPVFPGVVLLPVIAKGLGIIAGGVGTLGVVRNVDEKFDKKYRK